MDESYRFVKKMESILLPVGLIFLYDTHRHGTHIITCPNLVCAEIIVFSRPILIDVASLLSFYGY
jgi:hypothetical protein